MPVFESLLNAMFRPQRSPELLINGKGKTFVCLLLVLTVTFVLLFVAPIISAYQTFFDFLKNDVPHFVVSSNGLMIAEPYTLEAYPFYIELDDTDNISVKELHSHGEYPLVIICDATRLHMIIGGESQSIPYFHLGSSSFSPQMLFVQKDAVLYLCIMILIFIFLIYFFGSFFSALLYSIAAVIFNAIFHARLSYGELYKLSLYSLLLPSLLQWVFSLIPQVILPAIAGILVFIMPIVMLGLYIHALRRTPNEEEPEDPDNKPKVIRI